MILDRVVDGRLKWSVLLDLAESRIFWIEHAIDCINGVVMVVYRLLRSDEEWINGLHRKDNFDANISAEAHIERASYQRRGSRFISASKSLDVCLFYASKALHGRGAARLKDLRIATINLKLNPSVWEVSQEMFRKKMGIEGSAAINYAKKSDSSR
jgi:hypothetical protein